MAKLNGKKIGIDKLAVDLVREYGGDAHLWYDRDADLADQLVFDSEDEEEALYEAIDEVLLIYDHVFGRVAKGKQSLASLRAVLPG
jgi:hypothetical protein